MYTDKIDEIIARVLSREASPEDDWIFEQWLDGSEENQEIFDLLKKEWEFNRNSYKVVNAGEIKNKIWKQVHGSREKKHQAGRAMGVAMYFKIAAAVAIIAVAAFFANPEQPQPVPVKWITKSNPAGMKSKIFLPDGSQVWLNSLSELRYAENLGDADRTIFLEGEAFFEVAKDPERPFIVIAKNISTTALGTSFNINAFEDTFQVSLVTGKVKVAGLDSLESGLEGLILNPGQSAVYKNKDGKLVLGDFELSEAIGWKDGELHFEDASFREVLDKLELWYGVTVRVDSNLNIDKHYTGRFKNESLKNVMENISFSLNLKYEIRDKTLNILEENRR